MATKTDHGFDASKHPRAADGRFGSVAGQHAGHGQPTEGSRPAHGDKGVTGALDRLTDDERPDIHTITLAPMRESAGLVTAAETHLDTGEIVVNVHHRAYKHAQSGDDTELAGVLAHERFHQQHGADEAAAYDRQLAVLRRLGARPSLIKEIEHAKFVVVRARAQVVGSKLSETSLLVDPTAVPSRCSECGSPLMYRGTEQHCSGCDLVIDLRDDPAAHAERTALAERAAEQRERSRWRELRHRFLAELRGGTSRDDDEDDQRHPRCGDPSRFVWDESIFLQRDDGRARLIAQSTSQPGNRVDAETIDQLRRRLK